MGIILIVSACQGASLSAVQPIQIASSPLPTLLPATVTQTSAPTPTPSPTSPPTPTWIVQGPGDVTVPIILYHHISISPINSRYYVPPETFEKQIKLMHDWNYTTITIKQLLQAINNGADLPPHPIIITFDDGHLDNYTAAYPIMKKYGYTGVLYIVYNYIGADGYMNAEQIQEMHANGWEVGSHSLNHYDLTKLDDAAKHKEIIESRTRLEQLLGFPILTFAYPFGFRDAATMDFVRFAGYEAAMGASGYTPAQGKWNINYLQRVEIKGNEDAKTFTRFLPWKGDPSFLPTDTPVPPDN